MNSYPWIYTPFDALKGLQDELRKRELDKITPTIVTNLFSKVKVRDCVEVIYGNTFIHLEGKVSEVTSEWMVIDYKIILFDQVYYLYIK